MPSDQTQPSPPAPPPRPEVVRDTIRALAQNTANIQWRKHAHERMVERDITDRMAARREVGVVVSVVEGTKLRVITVEWEDLR